MKHRGTLEDWNDDRGFGFIAPDGGGGRVFVHIKAFREAGRRPAGGEKVTYRLGRDPDGRERAENVELAGGKGRSRWTYRLRKSWPALVFLGLVAGVVAAGKLPPATLGLYGLLGLVTFVFYAVDKGAARKGRWRTPEAHLHLLALAGGWPGALLAQQLLRHKSRKRSFRVVFWITVVLHCGLFAWAVLTPEGAEAVRSVTDPVRAEELEWL